MARKALLRYPVALYNCKVGRDRGHVGKWVARFLRAHKIGVLMLMEASQYQQQFRQIEGYTLFQYDSFTDSDNVAVLVRDDLVSRFEFLRRMKVWWVGKRKQRRAPRTVLGVKAGRVLWIATHRAAYQWNPQNHVANREIDDFLIAEARDLPRSRVVPGGDFNDGARSPEIERVCREGGYTESSPGGVMFYLQHGDVEIENVHEIADDGGSDHKPVIGTAVVYKHGGR